MIAGIVRWWSSITTNDIGAAALILTIAFLLWNLDAVLQQMGDRRRWR